MKKTRRTSIIILLLGLILILVVLFRSVILVNVVTPLALVFWVAWRILLSVDQKIYWGMLIFAVFFYVFYRLAMEPAATEKNRLSSSNAALENVNYWRNTILLTCDEIEQDNLLKRSLGELLAKIYAAKQSDAASFEIYDALKQYQIPLPKHIYTFLFPAELSGTGQSIKRFLKSILETPRKQFRRWTHRDVTEYYQSIEEVLAFMETSMEVNQYDEHKPTISR